MEKTGRAVAWICMFSTLLVGCYTSAAIDPGAQKERMYSERITYIVTKDSTMYKFNYSPPTIHPEYLRGMADFRTPKGNSTREVILPLANIAHVGVREFQVETTLWTVLGIAAAIGVAYAVAYGIAVANMY
jgi:hypothetical protein